MVFLNLNGNANKLRRLCGLRNIVSFAKLAIIFSIGNDKLIFTLFFVVGIMLVYQKCNTDVKSRVYLF